MSAGGQAHFAEVILSRQQALGMGWTSKILRWPGMSPRSQPTSEHDRVLYSRERSKVIVAGDNPIQRFEDDTLGRGVVARSFAQQVLALDVREGVVVGVLGAWGSVVPPTRRVYYGTISYAAGGSSGLLARPGRMEKW